MVSGAVQYSSTILSTHGQQKAVNIPPMCMRACVHVCMRADVVLSFQLTFLCVCVRGVPPAHKSDRGVKKQKAMNIRAFFFALHTRSPFDARLWASEGALFPTPMAARSALACFVKCENMCKLSARYAYSTYSTGTRYARYTYSTVTRYAGYAYSMYSTVTRYARYACSTGFWTRETCHTHPGVPMPRSCVTQGREDVRAVVMLQ